MAPQRKSRKRVRWADEEQTRTPVILTAVMITIIFLTLALAKRQRFWERGETQQIPHLVALVEPRSQAMGNWAELDTEIPPPGNTSVLQTFQVDVPLLGCDGNVVGAGTADGFNDIPTMLPDSRSMSCQVTLAVHTFANSFGNPFVGNYTPPACLNDSNTAIMNLTVQSQGRQFDRLAIVYFGDIEVFRTSTEEPRRQGISYTYVKDMSPYMYLWKQTQKVIFDLGNAVDVNLTGVYNTTLTASFFKAPQAVTPADIIIPISARQSTNGSQVSVFGIPQQVASNVITNFPRNAIKAIFTVSATGQGNEEFWWNNVLQSNTQTYNASGATLFGYSPFREVQVLIDRQLVGVQWPFPVIFTGGVSPSFWSPMVGIDAFDLKEGEIDISAWLPLLCDGKSHNFTVNVVGLVDDGGSAATLSAGVNSAWLVTGKIFVWLDSDPASITTGAAPTIAGQDPSISVSQSLTKNSTGSNDTLDYTTSVSRTFRVTGSISTSLGESAVSWTQTLRHTDKGVLSNNGMAQLNNISTTGTDISTHGSDAAGGFTNQYSYPLNANVTIQTLQNGTTRLDAMLERTKAVNRTNPGSAVTPSGMQLFAVLRATANLVPRLSGTTFTTTQRGTAMLLIPADGSAGAGSASAGSQAQTLRFGGISRQGWMGDEPDMELYYRDASVKDDGTVIRDVERLAREDVVGKRPPATMSER